MEERRLWLKSALECLSKSESDKCHSLLGEENDRVKQNRAELWENENTSYDEQIMNLHVTHLEEEIIKLKDQVDKSENQVDDLSENLKSKEEELHTLKEFSEKEISMLKAQIKERRTWLSSVLQYFNIHSSPSSVSFKKESCESPISSWNSKSENDQYLRLSVSLLVLIPGLIYLVSSSRTLSILMVVPFVLIIYIILAFEKKDKCLNLLAEETETSYDEEIMNLHVTHLEEEVIKLRDQVEKGENQVDELSEELKLKEEELRSLKEFSDKEIYKLKAQIEESEAKKHVHEISNLVEQLEMANEKLKTSEDENAVLRKELESKACETHQLQGQLIEAEEYIAESDFELVSGRKHSQILESFLTIYEREVQILKSEMVNSQNKFSLEKDELHFDIASLLKTKIELTATLADCEFRKNELEGKLRKSEAEKLKQEELHATTQKELGWRLQDLEAITKELCMVMIERDEANVKIDRLEAEICTLKIDRSGYL